MNSPRSNSSPKYKNLISKHKHSPIELKEKMRKNYKEKVQNCRNMLLNKFRGTIIENELCSTLTDIYKSMFDVSEDFIISADESKLLEELKKELVQEELEWMLKEYEKTQIDNIDWSSIEEENNVICPVCQKINFDLKNDILSCSFCELAVNTQKPLSEIRNNIVACIGNHNTVCCNEAQFTGITELTETHIYLICDSCLEVKLVV